VRTGLATKSRRSPAERRCASRVLTFAEPTSAAGLRKNRALSGVSRNARPETASEVDRSFRVCAYSRTANRLPVAAQEHTALATRKDIPLTSAWRSQPRRAKPSGERRRVCPPNPARFPSSSARRPGDRGQRRGSRSRAPSPPLDRNHRSPLSPTPAASEPPVEIEQLRRGAQSGPHQSLRLSATRRDGNRRNRPLRSHPSQGPRSAPESRAGTRSSLFT
jgi:hypothetical protein